MKKIFVNLYNASGELVKKGYVTSDKDDLSFVEQIVWKSVPDVKVEIAYTLRCQYCASDEDVYDTYEYGVVCNECLYKIEENIDCRDTIDPYEY